MNQEQRWEYEQHVFLDESALRAFMNADDPQYAKARSFFLDLHDLDRCFLTTSYIVFDTHEWLRDNCGYTHAEYFLNAIEKAIANGRLALISGNGQLEQEAKNLLSQVPDFRFSLGEAVTAVVMFTYRIRRIFTFNQAFHKLPTLYDEIKVIPSIQ
ncbi:hypothetical protein J31TS4_22230 [Paenibacillus sp. J31TS4]|uniref:type II toxin-antitoxin system VapC family toxin n=1 Tax=Paenibacillus sp. J31TS4 TaxID=2807195 RepID=UPI001AFE87AC|nr:hypothetical protein [Paenibacillus sp. J31TS4]GIP38943.1 hypothetical protein J31TS4_22230 [Paenibacillus sp. J31TS4]